MAKTAAKYDPVAFLNKEEDMIAYLNAALEDGDPALLTAALGDIARARGMTQLARETGITRDGLYKALSPNGNPSFVTVHKVIRALGYQLDVTTSTAKNDTGKDLMQA